MLNFTNNSNSIRFNLSNLEASILNEERRLKFGQATINYSINSLQLQDLSPNLPLQLGQQKQKCLHLSGCGFYQMLTYAVWQYLLVNRCQQKNDIITKIRKLIVHKDFMQTSPSTKGLLVKGIKQMHDYIELSSVNQPVAHCLWKTDSMLAFTQFWKSLLARQSVKNIINAEQTQQLQKSIFQLLAEFMQLSILVYYQNGQLQFEKQQYCSKSPSSLCLSLIIYSKKFKPHERSRLLDSQCLADDPSIIESLEWSYIIFSQAKPIKAKDLSQFSREDISQINPKIDESVQDQKEQLIKLFKLRTKSQLTLKRLGEDLNKPKDQMLSPIQTSHIKDNNALETTRTKKSGITTAECDKYCHTKKSTFIQDRVDFQQTATHLQNIKTHLIRGNKLIEDMKVFCQKITV